MVIDGKKRDTALLSKNILYAADIQKLNDPFEALLNCLNHMSMNIG